MLSVTKLPESTLFLRNVTNEPPARELHGFLGGFSTAPAAFWAFNPMLHF
jgi:hypothetical protein